MSTVKEQSRQIIADILRNPSYANFIKLNRETVRKRKKYVKTANNNKKKSKQLKICTNNHII